MLSHAWKILAVLGFQFLCFRGGIADDFKAPEGMTTSYLVETCLGGNPWEDRNDYDKPGAFLTYCFAYLRATGNVFSCIPDNVTGKQLTQAFAKYVREHPGIMQAPAAGIVVQAMVEAFPCKPR